MMLYKNTKAIVHSPDGDTDFFNIDAGVLQNTIFVYTLPRRRISNVNRSNKKRFYIFKKKARSRRYPAETMTDADEADDLALLVNTPAQVESLLHNLEQAAGSIGLNVNETEYICFKQKGAVSILSVKPLKLVD